MADKQTVLVIKADAAQAREDLERVEKAVEDVREAAGKAAGNGSADGQQQAGATPSQINRSGSSAAPAAAPDKDATRKAGAELGKYFITYLATNAAKTVFDLMRDPITSNAKVDRMESTWTNAFGGAAGGAVVGSKFGPIGGVVGALLGGVGGGALGWLGGNHAIENKKMVARHQREHQDRLALQGEADAGADEAFSMRLAMLPRSRQIRALKDRIREIETGWGSGSVKSLSEAMAGAEKAGTMDSALYEEMAARRGVQMNRSAALSARLRAIERAPMSALVAGQDYADAFAARGLRIGAAVNVAQENQDLLLELRKINTQLERMASGTDLEAAPPPVVSVF